MKQLLADKKNQWLLVFVIAVLGSLFYMYIMKRRECVEGFSPSIMGKSHKTSGAQIVNAFRLTALRKDKVTRASAGSDLADVRQEIADLPKLPYDFNMDSNIDQETYKVQKRLFTGYTSLFERLANKLIYVNETQLLGVVMLSKQVIFKWIGERAFVGGLSEPAILNLNWTFPAVCKLVLLIQDYLTIQEMDVIYDYMRTILERLEDRLGGTENSHRYAYSNACLYGAMVLKDIKYYQRGVEGFFKGIVMIDDLTGVFKGEKRGSKGNSYAMKYMLNSAHILHVNEESVHTNKKMHVAMNAIMSGIMEEDHDNIASYFPMFSVYTSIYGTSKIENKNMLYYQNVIKPNLIYTCYVQDPVDLPMLGLGDGSTTD